MVDPFLIGALVWLSERLAGRGVDWFFDSAFDRPRLSVTQAKRHDLTVAGAQATSDVDFTVRHHLARTRVPVILTFQKFGDRSTGTTFPMVLGDTAQVTLPRDHYFVTALIVDLPTTQTAKPTLRGLGWAQPWVAGNHTATITIATQHPTDELVEKIGLKKPDGSVLFTLPPAPSPQTWPNTTTPSLRTSIGPTEQNVLMPRPRKIFPLAETSSEPAQCRARALLGDKQCPFPADQDRLCLLHRNMLNSGGDVRDNFTGKRIRPS